MGHNSHLARWAGFRPGRNMLRPLLRCMYAPPEVTPVLTRTGLYSKDSDWSDCNTPRSTRSSSPSTSILVKIGASTFKRNSVRDFRVFHPPAQPEQEPVLPRRDITLRHPGALS